MPKTATLPKYIFIAKLLQKRKKLKIRQTAKPLHSLPKSFEKCQIWLIWHRKCHMATRSKK